MWKKNVTETNNQNQEMLQLRLLNSGVMKQKFNFIIVTSLVGMSEKTGLVK